MSSKTVFVLALFILTVSLALVFACQNNNNGERAVLDDDAGGNGGGGDDDAADDDASDDDTFDDDTVVGDDDTIGDDDTFVPDCADAFDYLYNTCHVEVTDPNTGDPVALGDIITMCDAGLTTWVNSIFTCIAENYGNCPAMITCLP